MNNEDIQVRVKRDFSYNPITGILTRITGKRAGTRGTLNHHGYIMIKWHQRLYSATHLIWVYCYGDWPKYTIDHKNRIKSDNRLDNLRDITQSEQNLNKTSSEALDKGVYARGERFRAQVTRNGSVVHLGTFNSKEEAIVAVRLHERILCTPP